MPKIVIEKGNERGRSILLSGAGSLLVGRDPKAHIQVSDTMSSRQHFKIFTRDGKYFIRDLKSSNGTWVNGKRIVEEELQLNDQIRIGETLMSFVSENFHAASDPNVGRAIDGYKILARVGRGGMGTVYRAQQMSLNRTVAMKILSHDLVKDKTFIDLFRQEARAAAQLNHPNIVQVYDVGREESTNTYYIAMEYVGKGSLQERIGRAKKLSLDVALPFMLDAARGLEYAHKKNIVHRDIKPDNLMVNEDGVVKICDLGLAKNLADTPNEDEGIFGTPHYIAPEQALGKQVDTRADMYALGATFYRILAGRTPFNGPTVKDIVKKQIKEEPQSLKEVAPELPQELCDIVHRMMRKNPDERFQTPMELLDALDKVRRLVDGGVAKSGTGGESSGRSWKWLTAMVAALLLTAVVWGVISSMKKEQLDNDSGNSPEDEIVERIEVPGLSEIQRKEFDEIYEHFSGFRDQDPREIYRRKVANWVETTRFSLPELVKVLTLAPGALNPSNQLENLQEEADDRIRVINDFLSGMEGELRAKMEDQVKPIIAGYETRKAQCAEVGSVYNAMKEHLGFFGAHKSALDLIPSALIEMDRVPDYQQAILALTVDLPALNTSFYDKTKESDWNRKIFGCVLEKIEKDWSLKAVRLKNTIESSVENEISDVTRDALIQENVTSEIDNPENKVDARSIDEFIKNGREKVLGHLDFLKGLQNLDSFSSQYETKRSAWSAKIDGLKDEYLKAWGKSDADTLRDAFKDVIVLLGEFDYVGAKKKFDFPVGVLRTEEGMQKREVYLNALKEHEEFFDRLGKEVPNHNVKIPYALEVNPAKDGLVVGLNSKDGDLYIQIKRRHKDKPGVFITDDVLLAKASRAWLPALWRDIKSEKIDDCLNALDFMYPHWLRCGERKTLDNEAGGKIWELAKELATNMRGMKLSEQQKKRLDDIWKRYSDEKRIGFFAEEAEKEVAGNRKADPDRARGAIKSMRFHYISTEWVKNRATELGKRNAEEYFLYLETWVDQAEMEARYAEIVAQLNKDLPAVYKRIQSSSKNFGKAAENRKQVLRNLFNICSGHAALIEKIGGNKDRENERMRDAQNYLVPELMDLESFTSNNFDTALRQYEYLDSSYSAMWRVKYALLSGQSGGAEAVLEKWLKDIRAWQKQNKKKQDEGMWAYNQAKDYFSNFGRKIEARDALIKERAAGNWHNLNNQWTLISWYMPSNHTPGDFGHEYSRNSDFVGWRIEMEFYKVMLEAYKQKIPNFNMYDEKYFGFWWNWLECMHFFGEQRGVQEAAKIIEENYTKQYEGFISSRIEGDQSAKEKQQMKEYKIKLKLLYYKMFAEYAMGGGRPMADPKFSLLKETKLLYGDSKGVWKHFDLMFQYMTKR